MKKRILIIEDDLFLTTIYKNFFQAAGHDVETAVDGEQGLRKITDLRIDLVQVDLMVPKINGVELIRRVRLLPAQRNLPIIVLSGCHHPETVNEAWRVGATRVISKVTATPGAVLETVTELLKVPTPAASL